MPDITAKREPGSYKDITAKREPGSYKDIGNNQGVATQSMLSDMSVRDNARVQKRLNKKSTWDTIIGGVKDVINVGKGVMDIANSYEDLQIKDYQLEQAKLNRQNQELQAENTKTKLTSQSIKNDRQIKNAKETNKFLDSLANAAYNNDDNEIVKLTLENPKLALKNRDDLLAIADDFDEQGKTQQANTIRLAVTPGNKTSQLQKLYSETGESNVADKNKYNEYLKYRANVDSLQNVFNSPDNETKLAKLGLGNSSNLPNDLLTKCTNITTSNTVNSNLDSKQYTNSLISSDSNITPNNLQTDISGKNVQFLDITCNVDGEPHTERFVYNANDSINLPTFNENGVITGEQESLIGESVSSLISKWKQYMKQTGKSIQNTPKITTEEVLKTQQTRRALSEQELRLGKRPSINKNNLLQSEKQLKKDKTTEDNINFIISSKAKDVLNSLESRNNVLSKVNITEEQYQSLSPSDKVRILEDVMKFLYISGKDAEKEELVKISETIKSKYGLKE